MSEGPKTLGELLAQLDRAGEAVDWGGEIARDIAASLRNILHGTDEAPGLVERIHGRVLQNAWPVPGEWKESLTAEITEGG